MQPQQPQPYQQPMQSVDFTQPPAPQPAPVQPQPLQPQAPQFDPDQFKREIVDELKNAITPQQPTTDNTQDQPQKKYDDWDTVFADVDARVEQKLQEQHQQQEAVNQQLTEQEKQNQRIIDESLNSLRTAGYLPPVADPFNQTDPGKQAEFELIGYALSLGATDLTKAAQELKFRHDAGFKFDYNNKQFVRTQQPQDNSFFGNPNQQSQAPMQQMQPQQQYVQQPVGPQNPYMGGQSQPQYPAGFNAPVSNGNGYIGAPGQIPSTKVLRNASYDDLVNLFDRTQ